MNRIKTIFKELAVTTAFVAIIVCADFADEIIAMYYSLEQSIIKNYTPMDMVAWIGVFFMSIMLVGMAWPQKKID